MSPKISIIMCTRDRGKFIGNAVKSVLRQTFTDWEVIIADDGSKDNTPSIAMDLSANDARIIYIRNAQPEMTIAQASNWALRRARGEHIAILDDDDAWCAEDKLAVQTEFLDKNSACVACGGGAIFTDERGVGQGQLLQPELNGELHRNALLRNPIINSTAMYRRVTACKVGYYDEGLAQFADWDFWLRMGLEGQLYNFQRCFVRYTIWKGNSSQTKRKENAKAAIKIVRRFKGKYPRYLTASVVARLYPIRSRLFFSIRLFWHRVALRLRPGKA